MRSGRAAGEAGFTLVEMLLALALLAVLLAAIPSTLSLANRTLATALRFERATNEEAAWSFMRRKVEETISLQTTASDGTFEIAFRGAPDAMTFIAPAQAGEVRGLAHFELRAANAGGSDALTLSWTSLRPAEGAGIERRVIARNVRHCRFRYYAPARLNEDAAWVETWTRRDELPALVELTLETPGRNAPRAVVIALPLRAPL